MRVAPKGMGLNDFVAGQEGDFGAEDLADFLQERSFENLIYK
jgi:hypothetical protein